MEYDYIYNIGQKIIDNKRNLTITNREKIKGYSKTLPNANIKVYTCTCINCGDTDVKITESHLKEGRGCPTCRGLKVVKGINDIPTTAPWMIPYFQGGVEEASQYTSNSNKKIFPVCPDCGKVSLKQYKINKIYTRKGFSCNCSDGISYPEKFVSEFLNQLNIDYISQASTNTLDWLKINIRYDFYIPDKNIIIEANGKQHYEYNNWTGKTLKQEQENDRMKKELAIHNGVEYYIQLDCRDSNKEYIKNSIINSELANIYDLNRISWDKCEIRALKNTTKEICEFYSNVSKDIKVISQRFKKSHDAIVRHLKAGSKYGWCIPPYDTSDKKIIISKDNSEKIFESAKYVSENSYEILGIDLIDAKYVRYLCKNNKTKNGYLFSYAS